MILGTEPGSVSRHPVVLGEYDDEIRGLLGEGREGGAHHFANLAEPLWPRTRDRGGDGRPIERTCERTARLRGIGGDVLDFGHYVT